MISATLVALAIALEILFLTLLGLGDLRARMAETIVLYLASSLVYLVSAYIILKILPAVNAHPKLRLFIVAAAVAFRITVWPLTPALSDDIYRYRWEGRLQAEGGNPYQARPNDPEWAALKDETFPLVVGRDFKAGYGPLLELVERWTYRAVRRVTADPRRQAFWFKAPFALFDLGAIVALWMLLRARGRPVERVLLYAWSPLPVMEFWATGHNDSAAIFLLLLALWAAARQRWIWAFTGLSLAASAKLWPLLLFPLFVGWRNGRPQRQRELLVALPIFAVTCWPYWSDVSDNFHFMSGFLGGWRNNDSLFGLLLWFTGNPVSAKYLAIALVAATVLFVTIRAKPLEESALTVTAVLLLVSANCHPWYLTWILPLLAFHPLPALVFWTVLVPLAHVVVIDWLRYGEWHGSTGLRWWIYGPVFALLAAHYFRQICRRPPLSS